MSTFGRIPSNKVIIASKPTESLSVVEISIFDKGFSFFSIDAIQIGLK